MLIYLVFTITLFAVMAIIVGQQIRACSDFKPLPMGGTLNLLYYFQYRRHHGKPLGVNFWVFVAAHINLLVMFVLFIVRAI